MTTRWLLQPELQQPVSHARGAESKGSHFCIWCRFTLSVCLCIKLCAPISLLVSNLCLCGIAAHMSMLGLFEKKVIKKKMFY